MKMLPPSLSAVSAVFGDLPEDDKLSTGITVGYPILRIKGKVWSITRGSEEPTILMRPNNDGPRNSLDVVILAASQYVSKVYYETGYVEGSTDAPDCFSSNGIVPDPASTSKQCATCAACPHNKWGSRITPAGKKAKACSDSKRAAVVPLGDIRNSMFGGPMLCRVPAASLSEFGQYGDSLHAWGHRYFTVGTKVAFEAAEAYPKLNFEAIRTLTDEEAAAVMELRDSEIVKAILQEGTDHGAGVDQSEPTEPPKQVTSKVTPITAAKPQATHKKTPVPPPPSPVEEPKETKDTSGFGSSEAPAQSPRPQRKPQAATPPPPNPKPPVAEAAPVDEEEAEATDSFESTLDAKLAKLNSLYQE